MLKLLLEDVNEVQYLQCIMYLYTSIILGHNAIQDVKLCYDWSL